MNEAKLDRVSKKKVPEKVEKSEFDEPSLVKPKPPAREPEKKKKEKKKAAPPPPPVESESDESEEVPAPPSPPKVVEKPKVKK